MIIYRNIKNGIRNLIKWFKIIWNDRDWDEYFIYKILYHKLNNMEQLFKSDKVIGARSLQIANELRLAKLLCKRILDDNYLSNALTDYYNKYTIDDKLMTFENTEDKNYKQVVWTKDKKQINMYRKASKHSEYMEQQDKNLFWSYISKKINGWWD